MRGVIPCLFAALLPAFAADIGFVQQLQSTSVLQGQSATFSVVVTGTPPIYYRWIRAGSPYATSSVPTFTFTNNQTSVSIRVAATNLSTGPGGFNSSTVQLTVVPDTNAVALGFVQQPQPVTVLQGQPATFSVVVTGTPPIYYRWIQAGIPLFTSSVPTLTLTNNQTSTSIRVAATNIATGPGGLNSSTVLLTVLADADGDGMPDVWEVAHGLNPNDPADALLDADGDGMNNRDEYLAGTNPTNALSSLKLVMVPSSPGFLRFVAQTNRSYTVQYRSDLVYPGWANLTSVVEQSVVRTVAVVVPTLPAGIDWAVFYRVVSPLVP